jgi:hypothetical protein
MLSIIILNVIMVNVIILNVIMLNAIMLNAIMLKAIMASVMAPKTHFCLSWWSNSDEENRFVTMSAGRSSRRQRKERNR